MVDTVERDPSLALSMLSSSVDNRVDTFILEPNRGVRTCGHLLHVISPRHQSKAEVKRTWKHRGRVRFSWQKKNLKNPDADNSRRNDIACDGQEQQ